MPCLSRRIGQLKEPPANEIRETLAFTLCKVELCGKAIVLQSRFRRTRFRLVVNNNWQNKRKAKCNKMKQTVEQLLKHDYKEALWTDMKSQIESI